MIPCEEEVDATARRVDRVLVMDGVEMELEELLQNNMIVYDEKGDSENAVVETLQKLISRDGVQIFAHLI